MKKIFLLILSSQLIAMYAADQKAHTRVKPEASRNIETEIHSSTYALANTSLNSITQNQYPMWAFNRRIFPMVMHETSTAERLKYAMYILENQTFKYLGRLRLCGITVNGITDANIPTENRPKDYCLHHKFVLIEKGERKIVGTGSCHWSTDAFETFQENYAFIEDEQLYAQYLRQYRRLLARAKGKQPIPIANEPAPTVHTRLPRAYFCQNIVSIISELIEQEQTQVDIAAEHFTHSQVVNALLKNKSRQMRVLVDHKFKTYENPNLKRLVSEKVPTFYNNNGYTNRICHKMLLLHNTLGKKLLIIGSANLTQAVAGNEEDMTIIDGSSTRYQTIFDSYANHYEQMISHAAVAHEDDFIKTHKPEERECLLDSDEDE